MNISSGSWKGRRILSPQNKLKPTSDKVRQALFNSIRSEIQGCIFLDLFAGSGSVGITALSEGAKKAIFLEIEPQTYRALKTNLNSLANPNQYQTFCIDVKTMANLFNKSSFDIIFADPFYEDLSIYLKNLHKDSFAILNSGGMFILEHRKNCNIEEIQKLEGFEKSKQYGDTMLSFFLKK